MSLKEKLMGAWNTVKKAVENSNNVKTTTYPNDTSTYQDYRTSAKPEEKK